MGLSKEDRVLLYTKMYTAVSKATAETKNAKGEAIKVTYNGKVTDLFDGICNNAPTIRAFMWAVSHKTDALPTALFRVVSRGVNGTEISRIHSGFYDDQRNHITGTALIPFIMEAMKLWEPKSRAKKEPVAILPVEAPKLPEYAKFPVSPEQLTDAELDNAIQELQATLNAFVSEKNKRAEIVAKKRELFKTVSELIKGEGFTLDEIMQIVWYEGND